MLRRVLRVHTFGDGHGVDVARARFHLRRSVERSVLFEERLGGDEGFESGVFAGPQLIPQKLENVRAFAAARVADHEKYLFLPNRVLGFLGLGDESQQLKHVNEHHLRLEGAQGFVGLSGAARLLYEFGRLSAAHFGRALLLQFPQIAFQLHSCGRFPPPLRLLAQRQNDFALQHFLHRALREVSVVFNHVP